jgi:hypothetical protein
MHTVEILGYCLDVARRLGYEIRQDWLDGNGGGGCVLRGRKILFLDLAQNPSEQLDQVLESLRLDPDTPMQPMPDVVRDLIAVRKSA